MNKIVVLVSGSGTNLQRIMDAIAKGEIHNTKITQVIADRDCYGLQRAAKENIPHFLLKKGKNFSHRLDQQISEDTDLIVLAGFLSFLNKDFCEKWAGKIINIHPSLLPKFGGKGMWGMNVHKAVLEAQEKKSGATVHFVTSGIDEGEIVLQEEIPISETDSLDEIAEKVHQVEYKILPKAIEQILNKKSSN